MKKILILICAASVFLFNSCGKFDDLNVDPNKPTAVATSALLTSAERGISDIVGANIGALYAQHLSEITYTDDSRYVSIRVDFTGWYTEGLQNLETIIKLNSNDATKNEAAASGSNANQIAVAKILKAYYYHFMTDRWGPLPFSQALKGDEGLLLPKYDSQEAIYNGIFNLIDEALAGFDDGDGPSGDFIFNGDLAQWKKFANTVKMQAALRISDVNSSLGQSKFNEAINAGVIDSDVFYPYLGETNNQNPWYDRYITRTDFAISKHLLDYLVATDDPRRFSFADPTSLSVSAGTPELVGMEYGLAVPGVEPAAVSFPSSKYVRGQSSKLPIYTLAQVEFAKAEAVLRNWISGDAETHYKNAIKASMAQWQASLSEAEFESFYNQGDVKFDASNWKKSIGQQKWVALYIQGYEAWAEWRRLDHPSLVVGESLLNPSRNIPMRVMYSSSEANLNGANYQEAVNNFLGGKDDDGVKMWWDIY